MDARGNTNILKPNVASLGYALFLATNAAGVWGGVFPFLPLGFQTPEVLFWFFLGQSVILSLSFAASWVGSYFFPTATRRFLVKLASIPYFLGWVCLIAAIYIDAWALPLVVAGGALLGLGACGFFMMWQRVFSGLDPDTGNRDLLVGTAYAAILYFALYLIPQAVTAYLMPLVFLPLFGLCVTLSSRAIQTDQPMFSDVPRENPRVYRQVLRDHWRSALCIGAVAFCTGIMRAIAVAVPAVGAYVNALSMGGMLAAALLLIWLWSMKNVRLSIGSAYQVAFPFLITSFLVLPLLPIEYARWLAAGLYAVYSAAIVLMMMQCAQVSRDRGINPIFIYGFFGTIVYTLHSAGYLGGSLAESTDVIGIAPLAVVALVAIWALGAMHFVVSGGFSSALSRTFKSEPIELVALRPAGAAAEAVASKGGLPGFGGPAIPSELARSGSPTAQTASTAAGAIPAVQALASDSFSQKAQIIREQYRLSAREAEVMELIARGHSVARIAEMLVVSENTIRTHSKRIYAKLDIHKKQELVDLMESI